MPPSLAVQGTVLGGGRGFSQREEGHSAEVGLKVRRSAGKDQPNVSVQVHPARPGAEEPAGGAAGLSGTWQ